MPLVKVCATQARQACTPGAAFAARAGEPLQLPRKRPLLQRGKQRVEGGQGAALGGFEGFNGLDAGGEGLLEGERGKRTR